MSRLINSYLYVIEEDEGSEANEQGIGTEFVESVSGPFYSQPPGDAVDFIEEG